jgi:glutathione S-transferase
MSIDTTRLLHMVGAPGSPYSRKLRAVLRYRRIPYAWINQGWPEAARLPEPPVGLLPTLVVTDADGTRSARIDSTPLIRELERSVTDRSVIPLDPALAFLDALIEDFADEWLTKAMFHYRWAFPADVAHAAAILPRWFRIDGPEDAAVEAGRQFARRQVDRLGVVGSNQATAATIEGSYLRLLRLLAARLVEAPFLLGGRPGCGDFAIYGQLTQLCAFDPTPRALALAHAPRVVAWVDCVEDLSGLDPQSRDWVDADALPQTVRALLAEIGRVYAPFLLANAAALATGADSVECEIDGRAWRQKPFPYQGKCLVELRRAHAALAAGDRARVDAMLAGTGCEALFAHA